MSEVVIKKADLAWMAIAGFVVAYDYWAIKTHNETLSRAYWRALRHPKTRWPAILIVSGLYKHLVFPDFLPQVDPLNHVAERWHRKAGE